MQALQISLVELTPWQRVVTRAWHSTVLLLAVALPFELASPWLSLGDVLVFTNLELIVLITLALWSVHLLLDAPTIKQLFSTPLVRPLALLFLTYLLASVLSPIEPFHALKVTARWGIGIAVYVMVVDALRTGLRAFDLLRAIVISGIVVAVLACLEIAVPSSVLGLLQPFRLAPQFRVGDQVRASSTLAYATITAQYLEIIFIFLVGWLAVELQQNQRSKTAILVAGLALVAQALVLTLTRSAPAAVLLALPLIVTVRLPRFKLDAFARAAVIAELIFALIIAWSVFSQPLTLLRLTSESDRSWYRAQIEMAPLPSLAAGQTVTATVRLNNIGERAWETSGDAPVYLFYHWLSPDGVTALVSEGIHTRIPHPVAPGEMITMQARVLAPAQPGQYLLAWDMLREGLFWFSVLGNPTYNVPVTILPGARPLEREPGPVPSSNTASDLDIERPTLWRAALAMLASHPLLGVGPGNFRLALGAYLVQPVWDTRLHANNTYLEIFADAGLVGGGAFVVFLFALVRLALFRVRGMGGGGGRGDGSSLPWLQQILTATLCAALAAFLIHAVTDYFFEFTPTYLLFWIMVGLLAGQEFKKTEPSQSDSS